MTSPLVADPATSMVLPAYGGGSLVEVLPSLGAHLGVPGCTEDVLGLPPASRYVVLLIDGLGWPLLRRNLSGAPYLAWLLGDGRSITSGVPSTTATSLASLGTGLPPGQHGVVGYSSRVPATGEILNALTWESDVSPRSYQPRPTFFEQAVAAGVSVGSVALARFEGSGLTEAALRGPDFLAYPDEAAEDARIELTVHAATRGERSLVYAYERQLDHVGHGSGVASAGWLEQLRRIDGRCARLRGALPDEVRLVITGDHGMLDVPPVQQVVVEDEPQLLAGVSALAGEGRFRQLYVDADPVGAVAARWRDRLGDLAWVRTRDEAIEEGWFGPVAPAVRERYGHVLVALRGRAAVMTRQVPRELSLIGMHGSLTAEEMTVPLLCD